MIMNPLMSQDWKKNITNVKVPSIFVKMMGIQNTIFKFYFGVIFHKIEKKFGSYINILDIYIFNGFEYLFNHEKFGKNKCRKNK